MSSYILKLLTYGVLNCTLMMCFACWSGSKAKLVIAFTLFNSLVLMYFPNFDAWFWTFNIVLILLSTDIIMRRINPVPRYKYGEIMRAVRRVEVVGL